MDFFMHFYLLVLMYMFEFSGVLRKGLLECECSWLLAVICLILLFVCKNGLYKLNKRPQIKDNKLIRPSLFKKHNWHY